VFLPDPMVGSIQNEAAQTRIERLHELNGSCSGLALATSGRSNYSDQGLIRPVSTNCIDYEPHLSAIRRGGMDDDEDVRTAAVSRVSKFTIYTCVACGRGYRGESYQALGWPSPSGPIDVFHDRQCTSIFLRQGQIDSVA
jgi:hypothetical protein